MTRRRRCTLIAALSLATVAGAAVSSAPAAVSPGDSQYLDPIPANQSASTGSTSGSSASPMPGGDSQPLASEPPSQSNGTTAVSQSSGSGSSARQLAATGADIGLVALAGVGLLLAGIGLRLREPGA
jgi:ABC-type phosphate transport system substrate-binding protein